MSPDYREFELSQSPVQAEVTKWVEDVLSGRALPDRQSGIQSSVLRRVYELCPELQPAIIKGILILLHELADNPNSILRITLAGTWLLLLAERSFIPEEYRGGAIAAVLKLVHNSQPLEDFDRSLLPESDDIHLRAYQSLVALEYHADVSFWTRDSAVSKWYDVVAIEGIAQDSLDALFGWLLEIEWHPLIDRGLMNLGPYFVEKYGAEEIEKAAKILPQDKMNRLRKALFWD